MKHVLRVVAAFALALAFQAAHADVSPAAAFLTKLAGHWQGNGEVRQMAADMRMHWEPVLDGQFHRLSMEDVMTGADGKSWHFKAQGYYRVQTDDTMTIDWGTEAIERGRSSYRLADAALEVTDEVYTKEGELRVFGRTQLTRQE